MYKHVGREYRHTTARRALLLLAVGMLALLALFAAAPTGAQEADQLVLSQVEQAGDNQDDQGEGVAVDAAGNRYVVGSFERQAIFGSGTDVVTLRSRNAFDIFIAKYAPDGRLVWAQQAGGSGEDKGNAIAVSEDGDVYVTGSFVGISATDAIFGTGDDAVTLKSNSGSIDVFIAKYTADGRLDWVARAGGSDEDIGRDIAVDRGGNPVVTGSTGSNAITFENEDGTESDGAVLIPATGNGEDMFVARYSFGGQFAWANQAGGSNDDRGLSVAVDRFGTVYVTGFFGGTATFPSPFNNVEDVQLVSAGGADVFVARYNSGGQLRIARDGDEVIEPMQFGGPSNDIGEAIAVDNDRNVYVTGFFREEVAFGRFTLDSGGSSGGFLIKIEGSASPMSNVLQATQMIRARGNGLAFDSANRVFVTGQYNGTATIGRGSTAIDLAPAGSGSAHAFVAAFNPFSFAPVLAETAGGTITTRGQDIAIDANDQAHIIGRFTGSSTFGSGDNAVRLDSRDEDDMFLATYSLVGAEEPTATPTEQPTEEPTPEPTSEPTPEPTPEPLPEDIVFYISSSASGRVGGVRFFAEDIIAFDPSTETWALLIDGSDLPLGRNNITSFHWENNQSLLFSIDGSRSIPGVRGGVTPQDITRFIPTSLGRFTSGSFERFFDGSDVGLNDTDEEIDAIGIAPDGRLVISTVGRVEVPATGGGTLTAGGNDLLVLNADSLGDDTSGTWELFLDGESIGLADTFDENISALWVNADRSFHLNVNRNLTLDNQLSGDGQDIFTCDTTPACRDALLFDGSTVGINRGTIDAFAIGDEGVMGDIGGEPSEDGAQVFLPLVVR